MAFAQEQYLSIITETLLLKHYYRNLLTWVLQRCILSTDMTIPYCEFSLIQSGGDT